MYLTSRLTTFNIVGVKTWKVMKLGIQPVGTISLCCPHCGTDAEMPIGQIESPIIASIGLGLIFDNPSYIPEKDILPITVKCRSCRRVFTTESENG